MAIVAPTAGLDSDLVIPTGIEQKIEPESLAELRFGAYAEGSSYSTVTEPNESRESYAAFPTMSDGIRDLALHFKVEVQRKLVQSSQQAATWTWQGEYDKGHFLILNDEMVPIIEQRSRNVVPVANDQYFQLKKAGLAVGYEEMKTGAPTKLPHRLRIPHGDVQIYFVGLQGKPVNEVTGALGVSEPANNGGRIWLEAKLRIQSKWIPKILDPKGWTFHDYGVPITVGDLLHREVKLKSGGTATLLPNGKPTSLTGTQKPSILKPETRTVDLGGDANESGVIEGSVQGFPDDQRGIKYSITLSSVVPKPEGTPQDRIERLGPRKPGIVVLAGERFEFTGVPAGKWQLHAVAMIQSRRQIVGKPVQLDLGVKPQQATLVGIAFNSEEDTAGWVESISSAKKSEPDPASPPTDDLFEPSP